jgi:hypothetical protein
MPAVYGTYKTKDGTVVRSQFERTVYENAPDTALYEPITVTYPVVETRRYTPDFVLPSGMWVEVKGRLTAEDRVKMRRVRDAYPQQTIGFLFMRDNKLDKPSKTRYSEWATKHGFLWHIGDTIPPHWY